ncbi:MAG: hypothetical protein J5806_11545 [Lentisphaeria bacterium]|nr:hypothetical protein [Lentisphaeria bacterium]
MSGKMRIFWTAVNLMGIYSLALILNLVVMIFCGETAALILYLAGMIAAIAAAIRFIVLFVRKRIPAKKTPEPVCVSAEWPGPQN